MADSSAPNSFDTITTSSRTSIFGTAASSSSTPPHVDASEPTELPTIPSLAGFSVPDNPAGLLPSTIIMGQTLGNLVPPSLTNHYVLFQLLQNGEYSGIVQTTLKRLLESGREGRSMIMLCCALGAGYTQKSGSKILTAMEEQLSTSGQAKVSDSQWRILIRVCTITLEHQSIRENLQQYLREGMRSQVTAFVPLDITSTTAAQTMGTILLKLGQVRRGTLRRVHVTGSAQCAWVVEWARAMLGLCVCVYDLEGRRLASDFDYNVDWPHVTVRYVRPRGISTDLVTVVTEE